MSNLTRIRPRLGTLTFALTLALLTGCSSAPKTHPVTGHRAARSASPTTTTSRNLLPPGTTEFRFDDSRARSVATEIPGTRLRPGRTRRPRHLSIQ